MKPRKILICDDEPYILESVGHVAQTEGFTVITSENGGDVFPLARRESPDLIILDVSMPIKDGNTVCRELKSSAATKGIYVIILTALGQECDMHESYLSGADEFINKPFSPRQLRKRLQELLG
jgi:two-component system alkaline phosphatase synthesis response regulator PhoP